MTKYKAKGIRKINPRNKPGPKPRDPVAAFEKEVRRAAALVSTVEDAPVTTQEQADYVVTVQAALTRRPLSAKERMRIAYEMRVVRGYSYAEIAEVLGYASPVGAFNAVARVKQQVNPIDPACM